MLISCEALDTLRTLKNSRGITLHAPPDTMAKPPAEWDELVQNRFATVAFLRGARVNWMLLSVTDHGLRSFENCRVWCQHQITMAPDSHHEVPA